MKKKKKRHFKVKDWASDQETIKRPKKKNVRRIIELRQTQNQPKDILMDKRRKGFMVRESSENRKRDKCKPA